MARLRRLHPRQPGPGARRRPLPVRGRRGDVHRHRRGQPRRRAARGSRGVRPGPLLHVRHRGRADHRGARPGGDRGREGPRVRAARVPAEDPRRDGLAHPSRGRAAAVLMRVALGAFGAPPGDLAGNLARPQALLERAVAGGAALACFPELCLSGYLLDRDAYTDVLLAAVESARRTLAEDADRLGVAIIYGAPIRQDGALVNGVVMQPPGADAVAYAKTHL